VAEYRGEIAETGAQKDFAEMNRAVMRWIIAAFYFAAGLAHLLVPEKAAGNHAVMGAVCTHCDLRDRPV
jgi:hypothetical protein